MGRDKGYIGGCHTEEEGVVSRCFSSFSLFIYLSILLFAVISTCTTTQRGLNSIEVFLSITLYKCTMATQSTISVSIEPRLNELREPSVLSSWVNWTFCVWLHSEESDHPEFHSPCSPKCSMLWVFLLLLQFSLMVYYHILHLQKTSECKPLGSIATILFSSSCVVQKLNISETSPVPSLASKHNSWTIHPIVRISSWNRYCALFLHQEQNDNRQSQKDPSIINRKCCHIELISFQLGRTFLW